MDMIFKPPRPKKQAVLTTKKLGFNHIQILTLFPVLNA